LTRYRNGCEIIGTSKAGARPFPYGTWTQKLPSMTHPRAGLQSDEIGLPAGFSAGAYEEKKELYISQE
jgi:hypothetical protein